MRVLVLSTLLAYAAAAPSVLVPNAYAAVPVSVPVPAPTVPPGDLQAAAIDAQVQAEDRARAFADRARELAEQAAENPLEGVAEANDLAKETNEQGFWNAEEQKWQAVDALKTAEAEVNAAVSSNSEAIARSAFIPYVASSVVAGIPAIIPGYQVPIPSAVPSAPVAKTAEATQTEAAPAKPEENAAVKADEATVKAAEPAKPAEAEKPADSVQVESANLKASAPEAPKNENPFVIQSFAQTHPVFTPLALAPAGGALAYSQPWAAPVAYVQPGVKVGAPALHQLQGQLVAPAVLSTQW